MTDQSKKIGEEWRNLDAKKKKKYEDLASKDKERFQKEKDDAGPSHSQGAAKKKKKST